MKTSSLDLLESSELPTAQAHAILKVIEQEMASSQENLATRADLAELHLATKADIAELRSATEADFAELRSATKADITELRVETKADFAKLRSETKADIAELRSATNVGMAELRTEINSVEGRLSQMILKCFFGSVGLLAGAVYFLYAHSGK